jgi:hypothetical protein
MTTQATQQLEQPGIVEVYRTVFSRSFKMKVSFSYNNSIGSLFVTTVAALVLSYPVGAIACGTVQKAIGGSAAPNAIGQTTQNLSETSSVSPLSSYSLFASTSGISLPQERAGILHLDRETAVSDNPPDPVPPITDKSGGSS